MGAREIFKDVVVPALALITPFLVYVNNRKISELDAASKLRAADLADQVEQRLTDQGAAAAALAERVEQRLVGQAATDLRFKVYEAVTSSVEANNTRRQKVAVALVLSVLATDDGLRGSLLSVLQAEAQPAVQTQAARYIRESQAFGQTGAGVVQTPRDTLGLPPTLGQRGRVDVLWCTEVGDGAKLAKRIVDSLKEQRTEGTLAIRALPPSINASPDYRVAGLLIEHSPGDLARAERLQGVANGVLGRTGEKGFQLVPKVVGRKPTGYLTVFIC